MEQIWDIDDFVLIAGSQDLECIEGRSRYRNGMPLARVAQDPLHDIEHWLCSCLDSFVVSSSQFGAELEDKDHGRIILDTAVKWTLTVWRRAGQVLLLDANNAVVVILGKLLQKCLNQSLHCRRWEFTVYR